MLAFRSSIARLMLATATVGVGLAAARTQADFWLGALAMLAVGWVLMALREVVAARDWRPRAPWLATLAAFGAGLVYGFGPWSDVATRGARPRDPFHRPGYDRQLLPTSGALIRLADRLKLGGRAAITFIDPGSTEPPVVLIVDPGNDDLMPGFAARMRFLGSFSPCASWRVFFDACYVLVSLLLAVVAGVVVAGLARPGRGDRAGLAGPFLDDRAGRPTMAGR